MNLKTYGIESLAPEKLKTYELSQLTADTVSALPRSTTRSTCSRRTLAVWKRLRLIIRARQRAKQHRLWSRTWTRPTQSVTMPTKR